MEKKIWEFFKLSSLQYLQMLMKLLNIKSKQMLIFLPLGYD